MLSFILSTWRTKWVMIQCLGGGGRRIVYSRSPFILLHDEFETNISKKQTITKTLHVTDTEVILVSHVKYHNSDSKRVTRHLYVLTM